MAMKIWVDDIRTPPDDTWVWAKTSDEALELLKRFTYQGGLGIRASVEVMSLDHDLGGDDTSRPIILWLCEYGGWWPQEVRCHSANPVGREWLEGMIERYKK